MKKNWLIVFLVLSCSIFSQDFNFLELYVGDFEIVSSYKIQWTIKSEYKDLNWDERTAIFNSGAEIFERTEYLGYVHNPLKIEINNSGDSIRIEADGNFLVNVTNDNIDSLFQDSINEIYLSEHGSIDRIKFIDDNIVVVETWISSSLISTGVRIYRLNIYRKIS